MGNELMGWTNMILGKVSGLPLMEGPIYLTKEFAIERRHTEEVYIGEPIYIKHIWRELIR